MLKGSEKEMFKLTNIKFKNILDIPSLVINKPITCIVGSSGSGKTIRLARRRHCQSERPVHAPAKQCGIRRLPRAGQSLPRTLRRCLKYDIQKVV